MASVVAFKRTSRYLIASMFFDGFPPKTNDLLRATMPNCSEKIIAISLKLATLASGQFFLMIHIQTDRQTQRRKGNQHTWQISSCHAIMLLRMLLLRLAPLFCHHDHYWGNSAAKIECIMLVAEYFHSQLSSTVDHLLTQTPDCWPQMELYTV